MTKQDYFQARLAEGSVTPTLLCGHCSSILSRAKIFRNRGDSGRDVSCDFIGICSADDCGALNCCDQALARLDNPTSIIDMAS